MNESQYASRLDAMIIAVRHAQAAMADLSRDLDIARVAVGAMRSRTHYSIDEAAIALGLSRSTVSRRLIDGTFSSAKIGGRRRIPAGELELLGSQGTEAPKGESH